LAQEAEQPPASRALPHETLRMTRLRTLLHLVDADGFETERHRQRFRERRLLTGRVLLARIASDTGTTLERAACAACARVLDALVREEIVELIDVLLAAALHAPSAKELSTMAEASMLPEVQVG